MEVKINREIRNYTESMFFGLSMRQFIFSVLACGVAVGLYFILRPYFGVETLSGCAFWGGSLCHAGFITYHGMTAEQFIWGMAALGDVGTEGTQIRGQQLLLCGPQRDYRGIAEWRLRQEAQKQPKHLSKRKEEKHD